MTKKILRLVVIGFMVLTLVLAACGPATTTTPTTPTRQTTPTAPAPTTTSAPAPSAEKPQQEVVKPGAEVPQYGGTYTTRVQNTPTNFDPWQVAGNSLTYDSLIVPNWMEHPREEFDFNSSTYLPEKYWAGGLAESWEIPSDMKSITFHIRKGVYFHSIPPVNGREMTAYDIEYSWQRIFGLGSGFDKPAPTAPVWNYGPPKSIKATDKYTLVVQLAEPSLEAVRSFSKGRAELYTVAKETIAAWGDVNKWQRVIGTGPFVMKDYVPGSALTVVKNPNYWNYDSKNPQNRLPYVDKVMVLSIPDKSTALAAFRTGKIDLLTGMSWEDSQQITKTVPKAHQYTSWRSAISIELNQNFVPFKDIRVRRSLQQAIDLKTIAATYWGGIPDGNPVPQYGIGYKDLYTPYPQWPQELKDAYAYNPENAKKLLAGAGYPNGFKTKITVATSGVYHDQDLVAILISYWAKIGVDVVMELKESGAFNTYVYTSSLHEMAIAQYGAANQSSARPNHLSQTHNVIKGSNKPVDPVFEDMITRWNKTADPEEQKRLYKEIDLYANAQHWQINTQPTYLFHFVQPWVKRHPMVVTGADALDGQGASWIWIDEVLKKEMVH